MQPRLAQEDLPLEVDREVEVDMRGSIIVRVCIRVIVNAGNRLTAGIDGRRRRGRRLPDIGFRACSEQRRRRTKGNDFPL